MRETSVRLNLEITALSQGIESGLNIHSHRGIVPHVVDTVRPDTVRRQHAFAKGIPIGVTDDSDADNKVNSQRFHDLLESRLRECLEQGFWVHRKLKRKQKCGSSRELVRWHPSRAL